MSASSFWAQKAGSLKTAPSSPAFTEPPTTPAKKQTTMNGLVLKPMTNGANASSVRTSNSKKISWADSEDDEEFLASFSADKASPSTVLKASVLEKEARIAELESHVAATALRIEQLEALVTEKDKHILELKTKIEDVQLRISELHYIMAEKEAHISNIKKESQSNLLHVQELITVIDEKNRHIAVLEKGQSYQSATICDLETQTEGALRQASVNDNNSESESAVGTAHESGQSSKSVSESSFEVVEASSPAHSQESAVAVNVSKQPTTKSPIVKATGPTFGKSDFPIFVTRETLKVVPPAPAPKKLTFPIDFNKYGKKSAQPLSPRNKVQIEAKRAWGLASKAARDPRAAPPELNPSLDIRHMAHAQRALFANGPEVSILMGNVKLGTLPKFMLMQCSSTAYKHFTRHPSAPSFVLAADSMDVEAAKQHIQWMDEMTYQGRVYSLPLHTEQQHDEKNLRICRAARILGLNNTYVGHFTRQLCNRIRNQEATLAFAHLVCALATPDNDPIFDCLAHHLVHQRAHRANAVLNPQSVAALQAKHPMLARKIAAITQR